MRVRYGISIVLLLMALMTLLSILCACVKILIALDKSIRWLPRKVSDDFC